MNAKVIISTLMIALYASIVTAQQGLDPLLFTTQALKFSNNNFPISAASGMIPSVAKENGYASYLDNPAVMGLIGDNYYSLSFNVTSQDEESSFLNNRRDFDGTNFLLSDIGFAYKVPTAQGSLVFGGGYALHTNFKRGTNFNGFNSNSTITDMFAAQGSGSVAFNAFATDYGDVEQTFVESIFRIGLPPGSFPGINQTGETRESGYLGEFSAFVATEFQKNLFLGASLGITSGRYRIKRTVIETDINGSFDDAFIDSDDDGVADTDIDNLLFVEDNDSDIHGVSFRVGGLYKVIPNFQIGASYLFKSTLNVTEDFFNSAESTFDNGAGFRDFEEGRFKYDIKRPSKLSIGAALVDLNGFSFSGALDFIDYADAEIEFDDNSLILIEDEENSVIKNTFRDVVNIRAGMEYALLNGTKLKFGYAHLPAQSRAFDVDKDIFSLGGTFKIAPNVLFDLTGQFSNWDDRSILYSFEDFSDNLVQERIDQDVTRISLLAGIRVLF